MSTYFYLLSFKELLVIPVTHFLSAWIWYKINKFVAQECAKHLTLDFLPWYSTWEQWNDKHLLRPPSINDLGKILCPELKYAEQTIQKMLNRRFKRCWTDDSKDCRTHQIKYSPSSTIHTSESWYFYHAYQEAIQQDGNISPSCDNNLSIKRR